MSDRPDAQDLLMVAREELMQNLLPQLPASLRYQALMIANAMAISARECEQGKTATAREMAGLQDLLPQEAPQVAGETAQHTLLHLRRQLSKAIRAGQFDREEDRQRALTQHLAATAEGKVAISNPKLLAAKAAG